MTDQELARALFEAGLLTQEQVQSAASQRTAGKNFAQTVVQMGWVTPAQIAQFDPNALGGQAAPPMPTAPPTGGAWQGDSAIPSPMPPVGGSGAGSVHPSATIDFSTIGKAWELTKSNFGVWIPAVLIYGIAVAISSAPGRIAGAGSQTAQVDPNNPAAAFTMIGANLGASLIGQVIGILVGAFFMAGLYKMALNQIDGHPVSVNDLFSGGQYFGQMLIGQVIFNIALFIGFLLCCIPGLLVMGGLMFWTPLVVDRKMDAITAMTTSWNTLKSQVFTAIGFWIVAALAAMLGLIACGVGVLFTAPIGILAPALVYRNFFPAQGSAPQDQPNYPPPPIPAPF